MQTLVALRGVRCWDSESSVDDLGTERGVVYGRAVATLRSVEIFVGDLVLVGDLVCW